MKRHLIFLSLLFFSLLANAQSARGTFRIAGKAVNSVTGAPLAGARLELGPTSGAQWAKATLSSKDGSFAFDRLGPGKYQLYAERSGFARQGFDEHQGGFLSAIVVGNGIDSEHLLFRVQPGASIAGIIKDEYDEPVRNAQVTLFERTVHDGKLGTYAADRTQSDDRGTYKFSPLMAGTYYVVVNAHPWYARNAIRHAGGTIITSSIANGVSTTSSMTSSPADGSATTTFDDSLNVAFPLTYYSGATDAADASPIHLRTGEAFRADFNLRSVPAARIIIPVSKDQPQRQMAVMLVQKMFDDDIPAQTMGEMSTGDARVISGFAPGRYTVRLMGPNREQGERSEQLDLYGETTLDLNSIASNATARITGLASAEGVSLKQAFIQIRNRETEVARGARIEEDGKFRIEAIPPGKYEVSVGSNASLYLANMAVSNAKSSGRSIDIPSGADVRMAIILSKGVGEINGMAVRDGKGISGTQVILVPDDPQNHQALFRRDQSDSDGTFTLKQVVPGHYTLLAIENGWDVEWNDPKVLTEYLSKGQEVDVQPHGKYDVKVTVQQARSGALTE